VSRIRTTGVELDVLRKIGNTVSTVPEDFTLHRQMKKIFQARAKVSGGGGAGEASAGGGHRQLPFERALPAA
jgi:2-oxoglutarate dehydrogenase complex dehydrogenase (E1) component-like enzyme